MIIVSFFCLILCDVYDRSYVQKLD